MDMNGTVNVFVYGTLMKGEHNHYFLSEAEYMGEYKTEARWGLLNIGSFPGLVPHVMEVEGEVYKVSKATLNALDRLEGVAHGLYRRRDIVVFDDDGEGVEVEVYLWNSVPHSTDSLFPSWRGLA